MNLTRERSCKGKARHATRAAAMLALKRTAEQKAETTLEFYHCRYCAGWHVGHPSRSEQKQLRVRRLVKLIDKAMESTNGRAAS